MDLLQQCSDATPIPGPMPDGYDGKSQKVTADALQPNIKLELCDHSTSSVDESALQSSEPCDARVDDGLPAFIARLLGRTSMAQTLETPVSEEVVGLGGEWLFPYDWFDPASKEGKKSCNGTITVRILGARVDRLRS